MSETIKRLMKATKELVDAVSFDVNGIMLPTGWQGGNGGLVSRETIQKADEARRALNAMGPTDD